MSKMPNQIKRFPYFKNDTLQGWDSADELIIAHLNQQNLVDKKILIINDQFGAISCSLDQFNCVTYTDSFVSYMGIKENSEQNINPLRNLSDLSGNFDFVLIRIPKNMSYFEDILAHLTGHLKHDSQLICTSMVKHLPPAAFELLNKYIGQTTTSLAVKKARLIFTTFTKTKTSSPYPLSIEIEGEGFTHPFINHSNLFSREKLDIGTRFFLEHIPSGNYQTILDLGCANGIIGIRAKIFNPNSQIYFSDESSMAIQSAKINYAQYFSDEAKFYWTNCFEGQSENFLDLVLCNPPFHQQNTIGNFIAMQMFQDAYVSLKKGGTIRVIGNSHLAYQVKLKKIFGNCTIVATNNKFLVCESLK